MQRDGVTESTHLSHVRSPAQRRRWGLALLGSILVAGVGLQRLGLFDWRIALVLAGGYADHWGFAPALALATAALFSFGLPGSFMVWVAGILLPPALAAPAFVTGGTVGSLVARRLAALASGTPQTPSAGGRLLQILERRSDFPTLLAVRMAPAFPHSAINVAAGVLHVPWKRFFASTALGLAIKGTLYVVAIHEATRAATLEGAISWRTLAPLSALSLLVLLAPPLLRTLRGPRDSSKELRGTDPQADAHLRVRLRSPTSNALNQEGK